MLIVLQSILAYLTGTVLFDVIHYFFHQSMKSQHASLKMLGRLHGMHHRFFPATLTIQKTLWQENFIRHVTFEYVTQVCGTLFCLFFMHPYAIAFAIIFETCLFFSVYQWHGEDPHHRSIAKLSAHRGGMFVSGSYHALHHVYPNNFFSSSIKIIDYVLGTGLQLKGMRIALTGASGALGSQMKLLLEKAGAVVTPIKFGVDYDYHDYSRLKSVFANSDILFLCHGSKHDNAMEANCDSFIQMIELFKSMHAHRFLPVEIWGVGSEIECHPCFGIKKLYPYAESKRHYARYARACFRDTSIQYRHLVHAAFTSRMGPGLMTAKFAANVTMFMLKRGFKYIPVTYTGFAFINYFRFILGPTDDEPQRLKTVSQTKKD